MIYKSTVLAILGTSALVQGFVATAHAGVISRSVIEAAEVFKGAQYGITLDRAFERAVLAMKPLKGVKSLDLPLTSAVDDARKAMRANPRLSEEKYREMLKSLRASEASTFNGFGVPGDPIEELGRFFTDPRLAKVSTRDIYDRYLAYRVKQGAKSSRGLYFFVRTSDGPRDLAEKAVDRLKNAGLLAESDGLGHIRVLAASEKDVDVVMETLVDDSRLQFYGATRGASRPRLSEADVRTLQSRLDQLQQHVSEAGPRGSKSAEQSSDAATAASGTGTIGPEETNKTPAAQSNRAE